MKCHIGFEYLIKINDSSITSWPNNDKKIDLSIFDFSGRKINIDLRLLIVKSLIN